MSSPGHVFNVTSIPTSSVQATSTPTPMISGVRIKASANNLNLLYVGLTNTVTAGINAATDGWELSAGDELPIPVGLCNDLSNLWFIGSISGLRASVMWL